MFRFSINMKVSQIISVTPAFNFAGNKKHNNVINKVFGELKADVFTPGENHKNEILSKNILSQCKKFNISDYKKLTDIEKEALTKTSNFKIIKAAESNYELGLVLKKYLDKIYGEDKYVFVSIGTSPAGLARVLEFSGTQTKYLPISKIRKPDSMKLSEYKNGDMKLKNYGDFLKKQKITKEDINNSEKKYLFVDYESSGNSLKNFQKLLDVNYDIKENDKIKFLSLNTIMQMMCTSESFSPFKQERLLKDMDSYMFHYLQCHYIEDFAGIPHCSIKKLENISSLQNTENDNAKRYNYLIMHFLEEDGLLKNNPLNSNTL
ncbi:MAG: hypothetical protein LUG16_00870 [Candidatus Gastranaerophilales bacterium]|nr:hypothetical protein [Candidatus Gastranaerophilales bacterium]